MKMAITEAVKFLGVDISTLRRWEDEGKIKPERTRGGHRRYDKDELLSLSNKRKNIKLIGGNKMEIKLFRTDKKLMFRLPNEEKDTPAYELFLGVMMLKPEQIKEKLGNELPVVVAACEVSDKEELDIAKLNATLEIIYSK